MDKLFQGLLIIGFLFFLNKRRLIWVSPFPVKLQGRLTCFFTKLFWQDLRDAGIFNDNDPLQVWVCKGSEVDVHGLRNRESGFSRCKLIRHDDSETIKTKLDLRKYYSENIRMPCCSFPFHYFFFRPFTISGLAFNSVTPHCCRKSCTEWYVTGTHIRLDHIQIKIHHQASQMCCSFFQKWQVKWTFYLRL